MKYFFPPVLNLPILKIFGKGLKKWYNNFMFFHHHHIKRQKARETLLINPALKALLLISGLFMFAFAMFSPIYAIFVERVGGGIETAANSWAIFGLVAGVLTFITGKFENEMKDTELAIAWSQFVIGLGYVLLYFTQGVGMLYLVMIILGIGDALYWPAFHSTYSIHADGHKSTFQWGIYDGLAYFIPAIGSALGGWLVTQYGFGLIFIVMAALSFACGIYILFLPRKVL